MAAPSRTSRQRSSSEPSSFKSPSCSVRGPAHASASPTTGARAESVGKKAISPSATTSSALAGAAEPRSPGPVRPDPLCPEASSSPGRACQTTSPEAMSSSSIAGR